MAYWKTVFADGTSYSVTPWLPDAWSAICNNETNEPILFELDLDAPENARDVDWSAGIDDGDPVGALAVDLIFCWTDSGFNMPAGWGTTKPELYQAIRPWRKIMGQLTDGTFRADWPGQPFGAQLWGDGRRLLEVEPTLSAHVVGPVLNGMVGADQWSVVREIDQTALQDYCDEVNARMDAEYASRGYGDIGSSGNPRYDWGVSVGSYVTVADAAWTEVFA